MRQCVILVTAADGTLSVVGTAYGLAFRSRQAAENCARRMERDTPGLACRVVLIEKLAVP